MRVRVVTYNVLSPGNPDWERRRPLIARTLRDLAPDVVALQEVPIRDGPEAVADLLGDGYQVSGFSRASDDGVAGALATRVPHRVVTELDLRRGDGALPWAATLVVEADLPIGRTLVAHHKPSWQFGREADRLGQAAAAAEVLERHAGDAEHVLVLGDLDATPDADSLRFWRGRRVHDGVSVCYQDAWETVRPGEPGHTFDAENPLVRAGQVATAVSRRIDYVLVRSGPHGPTLRVLGCDRLLDRPVAGVWASDHYGVVADLAVPDHSPGSWGALDDAG